MPSAELLTPLVDGERDDSIFLLWDDASTACPPATPRRRFDVDVLPSLSAPWFAERFEALRSRVRLPAEKYARLLGVSRRTLYHWRADGRPSAEAIDLVEHLSAWVDELERHVSASDIQQLLDPEREGSVGALLASHDLDAAADRFRHVAEEAARPRPALRLDVLADDPAGNPPSATPDELRAALEAFARPRRGAARPGAQTEPPELTH
jgi:transcriptional regulator with XRE-family HTH domain